MMRDWSVRPCVRPVSAAHEKPLAMMPFAKPGPDREHALNGATARCGFSMLRVSTLCASLHVRPSQADLRIARGYAASGSRYRDPLVMIAQTVRAVLFANATAATFGLRRAIRFASHGRRALFFCA